MPLYDAMTTGRANAFRSAAKPAVAPCVGVDWAASGVPSATPAAAVAPAARKSRRETDMSAQIMGCLPREDEARSNPARAIARSVHAHRHSERSEESLASRSKAREWENGVRLELHRSVSATAFQRW